METNYQILNHYNTNKPSNQDLIDIFKGEWSSTLPPLNNESYISGHADLFNDPRIKLLNDHVGLNGKSVLELGPLEAGHTYMMHKFGASSIVAVEANNRALLKCLLVKEMYQLNRANFLYGGVIAYLDDTRRKFDVCVASGILYHMTDPSNFLELCSKVSDRLFIWTHYAGDKEIKSHPVLSEKIKHTEEKDYKGYKYAEYHYEYDAALGWAGFCGGATPYCRSITKETIFEILKLNGFQNIKVFFDELSSNPNGPQICFLAEK
ncbi:MAG: class I SAM-dependent methyltransferase [Bacteroidia bacterium]